MMSETLILNTGNKDKSKTCKKFTKPPVALDIFLKDLGTVIRDLSL